MPLVNDPVEDARASIYSDLLLGDCFRLPDFCFVVSAAFCRCAVFAVRALAAAREAFSALSLRCFAVKA